MDPTAAAAAVAAAANLNTNAAALAAAAVAMASGDSNGGVGAGTNHSWVHNGLGTPNLGHANLHSLHSASPCTHTSNTAFGGLVPGLPINQPGEYSL